MVGLLCVGIGGALNLKMEEWKSKKCDILNYNRWKIYKIEVRNKIILFLYVLLLNYIIV